MESSLPLSVLSAVEGLKVATPLFQGSVVPISIAILIFLFVAQKAGTKAIGAIFGPVITIWFVTLGVLGVLSIFSTPEVLQALNPFYGVQLIWNNLAHGGVILGSVFLAVTGAEALYADMGHFGRAPIRRAWILVVLPGLVLNYFGQGALLIRDASAAVNPFYKLAPEWALYPLVALATMAAVIASQALISGVFFSHTTGHSARLLPKNSDHHVG